MLVTVIKSNAYRYQHKIDWELARIGRIQTLQQRAVGLLGTLIISTSIDGGDVLASRAEPNDPPNPCDLCMAPKNKFNDPETCRTALRRNYAIGTLLSHLNPFSERRLGKRKRSLARAE
eukprot:5707571-Prymnesium_polylepis.1